MACSELLRQQLRREVALKPSHVEGAREAEWVLLDYFDFVVHVFIADKRDFFRLERLWGDAPRHEYSNDPDGDAHPLSQGPAGP